MRKHLMGYGKKSTQNMLGLLAKELEGIEVKMIEKRKFYSVEDSDMDDGHFLNNKQGRVD